MKLFLHALLCSFTLACTQLAYGQFNCNNIDFEDGNFTNWVGYYGNHSSSPVEGCCLSNGTPVSPNVGLLTTGVAPSNMPRHTITSGAGFDPNIPTLPIVSPFGGSYSCMIGDYTTGGHSEKLTYDMQVTAQNPNFTYHYAVVIQDGGHAAWEQPKFRLEVRTVPGNALVSCGQYNVTAAGNIPGFQDQNGFKYKPWSMVAVDLSPYIGQTVRISFETNDCEPTGHLCYAYVDASCNPMQIASTYCPGDPAATLTAPDGFQTYTWSTGATTQSIVVNNPTPNQVVSVVCAPFQGSNCSSTLQYTFSQNPPVTANFKVDSSCGQGAVLLIDSSTINVPNGQVTAWQWYVNNQLVSTDPNFTYGFPGPGDYNVTLIAQANGGCPDTTTNLISLPQGVEATTSTPNTTHNGYGVSCFGANDGTASVSASYGGAPYSFLWSDPAASTTATVTNLAGGIYTVTTTDHGGCQVVDTIEITEPAPITIAPTAIDVLCYGESTGSIALNPSGGVPTLTYIWSHSNTVTTPSVSNLTANSYQFTITDGNGCTFDSAIVITQPAAPYALAGTVTDVTCFSGNNGSIDLNSVSGNTAPYTYAWSTSPQQTTTIASQLTAGPYTVTVTDANSCTASVAFTVTQPAQLQGNLSKTDLLCNGDNSGTATANTTGGTVPYTYIWNDASNSTTAGITGLSAQGYSVTIYDSYQCSVVATTTLTQPAPLSITATHQDVACFGGSTGRAFSTAQGGTTPYGYVWTTSPAQTGATADNLTANTYTVTVTDAHNCTASVSETVNEPTLLTAAIIDTVHNICWNGTAGRAEVGGTGGSLPYTYNWDTNPAQNTAIINQLGAGTYNVTVTDDSLCTATATVTITQPTQITIAPTVAPALCYDSAQGSISLAVAQGTPAGSGPSGYTYNWSPGGWGSETITNLMAGTYDVTVYDANQCWEARSYNINQPAQLNIGTSRIDVSCYGYTDGSISIQAAGGTPSYTYSIWQSGSQLATNTSGAFNGLPLGSYVAQFHDANNCIINTPVTVLQPTELLIDTISADSVNCYSYSDGSISVLATGSVPPYTYTINNALSNTYGQFTGLTQGTYNVLITDSHNCFVNTVAIVNEPYLQMLTASPDSLVLKLGESKPITVSSNYDPAALYLWNTSEGLDCQDCPTNNVILYDNYIYTVTVTAHPHDLDCRTTIDIPVTVIPNYDVYIPNAFTPNGDGKNDFFAFYGNKPAIKQMNVKIFNRIGEKVFESDDLEFKWDGYFKGILQNPGVYVYTMQLTFVDNYTEEIRRGSITLIR